MSARLVITGEIARLFEAAGGLPREIKGEASNNLAYILRLMEYGHSRQLPEYWLRRRQRHYEELLRSEVDHALGAIIGDVGRAITSGVTMATLAITRDVSDHTPVLTGRAKGAWVARLPSGQRVAIGPRITAAQQRVIRRRLARGTP